MQVRAVTTIRVPAGTRLRLTPRQAASRAHILDREDGCYIAREPLQFKRGEVLDVLDVPKGWSGQVTVVDEASAPIPHSDGPPEPGKDEATGADAKSALAPAPKSSRVKKAKKPADKAAVKGV